MNEEEGKFKFTYFKIILVILEILQYGNEILRSLGIEDIIDDVGVFFR